MTIHKEFRNVEVVPFSDLMDNPRGGYFHRGGPIWPNWEDQHAARYQSDGRPCDVKPLPPVIPPVKLQGAAVWLGPQFPHFGHAVTDAATRFLAARDLPNETCLLIGARQAAPGRATPLSAVYKALLDWYGLNPARIVLVDKPYLVDTLLVSEQPEQRIRVGPSAEYLEALLRHQRSQKLVDWTSPDGQLFVSRSRMSARIAGEAYIDRFLAANGLRVLHPQTMPLRAQLAAYANAKKILFSEGSALHGLQLLGRIDACVNVLCRRKGNRLAEHLIAPRVRRLHYIDTDVVTLHGVSPSNKPVPETGLAISKSDALRDALYDLLGSISQPWDDVAFTAARQADIRNWLHKESTLPRFKAENYINVMYQTAEEAGVRSEIELALAKIPSLGHE